MESPPLIKISYLFFGAVLVFLPSVIHAEEQSKNTVDPAAFVAQQTNLPWHDRDLLGSFIYHYPVVIPPGRDNLQPNLELTYRSSDVSSENIAGSGWSVPIPFIQRVNKTGVEDLYNSTFFSSSLSGDLLPMSLTDNAHGNYGAKVETNSFSSYQFNTDETWIVKDANGVIYTFGGSESSRVYDPSDQTRVYKWYVSKIRNANNNFISFSYTKDQNQIYPSTISYTGNGMTDGIFNINFSFEPRPDETTSYASGFKITTSKRLSKIWNTINGTKVREYILTYTTGDNKTKSLLSSILEIGYDKNTIATSLPTTKFQYSNSNISWTQTNIDVPQKFVEAEGIDRGVRFADVNGDSLQDILFADSGTNQTAIYLNNSVGTGWIKSDSFEIPVRFLDAIAIGDQGVRLMDVNGDGLDDFVYGESDDPYDSSSEDLREVYLNDGSGWTKNDSYFLPVNFSNNEAPHKMSDTFARLGDVNGDGLIDILFTDPYSDTDVVYLNTGNENGWIQDQSYKDIPVDFGTKFGGDYRDSGVRVADVNHDGLADLVYGLINGGFQYPGSGVYINNGNNGWNFDSDHLLPVNFSLGGLDTGARLTDVNGDGFVDIVIGSDMNDLNAVYLNTGDGKGWTQVSGSLPILFTGYNTGNPNYDLGVRLVDVDGDGLEDLVYADGSKNAQPSTTYLHNGEVADLLTSITTSQGSITTVDYVSSVKDKAQPNLPFILQVVKSITTNDGLGNTSTTNYKYEDGDFYFENSIDREFAGFEKITTTDGEGNVIKQFFHQGNDTNSPLGESTDHRSKIGKIYKEEIYDKNNGLYRIKLFDWQSFDLGNEKSFVYLKKETEMMYDGDLDFVDRATSYVYDLDSGNLTQKTIESESIITTLNYAVDSSGKDTAFVATEILKDASGSIAKKTNYFYDNLPLGFVTKGNLTKKDEWISGSIFSSNTFTYDIYGNTLTQTDPLSNTTNFTYDANNLYPSSITNAIGQKQFFEYDFTFGKPTKTTEVNGMITEIDYDGLGRTMEERKSSPTNATMLEKTQSWNYDDLSSPRSVTHRTYLDDTIYKKEISYLDGFDRVIEVKTLNEDGTGYNETETTYDKLGRISKTTLPETSIGDEYDAATVSDALAETYTYDPLSRAISVSNVLGTTATKYNGFTKTITDQLGNKKDYVNDSLERLISVVEYLDGTTNTTTYTWNTAGNLTSTTDALGNVRNFTYDKRGLRLSAEDLHYPTDTTFGIWIYTYDAAGNLITSLSPNGVTVNYEYDTLNRQTSEDASDKTGVEVVYSYDACVNGIGQLCKTVVNGESTTEYSYDARGNKSSEKIIIDGTAYTTNYTYDLQGNVLTTVHPDGTYVINTYNSLGKIETIDNVISDTDYGPHGQVVSQTNTNGTITTYVYDENARYRLKQKTTTGFKKEEGNATTTTTTVSFYPTSGDGYVYRYATSWDTAHDATLGSSMSYTNSTTNVGTRKSGSYYYIYRTFLPFDTSSLPDDATITDAKLKVYVSTKKNDDNDGDDFVTVVQTSQSDTSKLTTSDYDLAGSINNPVEGIDPTERKDITNVSTNSYLAFSLNSTGRDWISKTGVTKLGLREGHDVLDSAFTNTSTLTKYNYLYIRAAEYAETSYDPILEITYTQTVPSSSEPVQTTLQNLSYSYDPVGNITQIIDASETQTAKKTQYVYDDLYRLTSSVISGAADNNNSTITYSYDAIGNITYRSDFGSYSYDKTGVANPHAVTNIAKTDGTILNYSYDKNGNLLNDGEKIYTWDYKNRLISSAEVVTQDIPTTTTTTVKFYPTPGDGQIYKSNSSWDTAHDATSGSGSYYTLSNLISGTSKSSTAYYIYRSFLPFDTSSLPDDATITDAKLNVFVYMKKNDDNDGDDFMTVVQTSQQNTTSLSSADFDLAGNINNPTEGIDVSERKDITNVPTNSYLAFSLNSTGRDWISKSGVTKLGLREGHDVIDSAFTSSSTTLSKYNYLYLRSSEYSGVSYDPYLEVTYTQTNIESNSTLSNIINYAYGSGMQRIKKSSDSSTTLYPTSDYSVKDGVATVYVSGSNGLVASISESKTSTIHTDHLGSTSVVTDKDGIMVELMDYNPYGTKRTNWSSAESLKAKSQKTYIGEYFDDESGLSYLNARYYDSQRGQFLSQDPLYLLIGSGTDKREQVALLDPQSQNSYSYSRGNPIILLDTDGKFWGQSAVMAAGSISNFALNTISFGGWGLSLDMIDQSTARMAQEGVSAGGLARTVGGIAVGVVSTATGSLVASITAGEATVLMGAEKVISNSSSHSSIKSINLSITQPYKRPSGSTTSAQRAAVQNQPCITCGQSAEKMYADHKTPLVQEYYSNGSIDLNRMRDISSVQPQCASCSAQQGGSLSQWSQGVKNILGL